MYVFLYNTCNVKTSLIQKNTHASFQYKQNNIRYKIMQLPFSKEVRKFQRMQYAGKIFAFHLEHRRAAHLNRLGYSSA